MEPGRPFVTAEEACELVAADLTAVEDALNRLRDTSTDLVDAGFRLEIAARLETVYRTVGGLSYRIVGELCDPPDGAPQRGVREKIATRLRLTRPEVARRARLAARIRPRRSVSGPPLPPELPRLAEAIRQGRVGEDHIEAIRLALKRLPAVVSAPNREWAEKKLVAHAKRQDAGFVETVGKALDAKLNPDGVFDERDRADRRHLTMGRQGPDGMSKLSGHLTPEARAYFEAVQAAVRPGHHVPGEEQAVVSASTDARSAGQRTHDAFVWGMRTALESGNLGQHRGIPVTVVARTTVQDLEQAARAMDDPSVPMPSPATTGGGSRLPMQDLIAMAARGSLQYLAVFDGHSERPLYLGRSRRIATADQRIICYARDGGCTRPGCTVPGYQCEVHHAPGWEPDGASDADKLYFACGPDNAAEARGDYQTVVTDDGRLGWSDGTGPPGVNRLHHPEELLGEDDP